MKEAELQEDKVHCFKKAMMQTADLLVDSYKWKCLAECAEDPNVREKYRHISETLAELYHEQHEAIMKRYRTA